MRYLLPLCISQTYTISLLIAHFYLVSFGGEVVGR